MLRPVSLLLFACAALFAHAAAAQDGRDLTEEARKQYVLGLKEAAALVKDRQFANAQARIDVLLTQRPREPQARFLKGVVQTEQGQDAAAIATFARTERGLSRAARAVQQSGGALRAEGRIRKRARGARRSPSRPRPTGASRTRIWATSTPGSPPRSTIAPRSSIAATRRRAGKLVLARELLQASPKRATAAVPAATAN